MRDYMTSFAKLISTFFFLGTVSKAPGTVASVVTSLIVILLIYFFPKIILVNYFVNILVIAIILLIIGALMTKIYVNKLVNQDPKEVVIDEVVGQLFSNYLCLCVWLSIRISQASQIKKTDFIFIRSILDNILFKSPIATIIMSTILFRIYDIFKPYPINLVDMKIKNYIGVMLDDLLAALFTGVTCYILFISFVSI